MRKQPPLLPAETLRRVLRVARTNGTSILLIAGFVAVVAAAGQDRMDMAVGLLVSGTGAIELHGAALLARAEGRGVRWLLMSQFLLLAAMMGYVWFRMTHIDVANMPTFFGEDAFRMTAAQQHVPVAQLKQEYYLWTYLMVGVGTAIYQGAMIWYYGRRSRTVLTALGQQ